MEWYKDQKRSLQNVLSLTLIRLCRKLYLQISDSRLTLLCLNAKLKVVCFVLLFLANFLLFFNVTIVMCYCILFFILISVQCFWHSLRSLKWINASLVLWLQVRELQKLMMPITVQSRVTLEEQQSARCCLCHQMFAVDPKGSSVFFASRRRCRISEVLIWAYNNNKTIYIVL